MLGQHASKALPGTNKNASSGDFDFFGQWPLLNVDKPWTGNISFAAEGRYKIGKLTPNELSASIGSLWKTTSGFNVQKFSMIEFYWEHGGAKDGGGYRIGKMKPSDIFDGYSFASSNTSFLSRSYSHTMAMSVPSAGLGAVGGLIMPDNFYVLAGIHDANADKISIGHIDRGEFFYALELGVKPGNGEPGAGNYHATLWHKDKRDKAGIPSGYGLALTAEQEFGPKSNITGFLRYSYGHGAGLDVRQTVSAGIVFDEVWGRNSDLIGLAATWGQPTNRSMRDQYSVEGYYRIQLTPDAHITPDLQLIFDPSMTTMFNTVVVGSLRLRMVF
jgi:carbohydrate-selective porin OprB